MRASLWIHALVLAFALGFAPTALAQGKKKRGYAKFKSDTGVLKEAPDPKSKDAVTIYYGQRLRFGEKKEGADKKPWFEGEVPFQKNQAGWLPRTYISTNPPPPLNKGTFTGEMKVKKGQKEISVANNATAAVKGLSKREKGHVERKVTDPDQQARALNIFAQLKTSIDGRGAVGGDKAVPGRYPDLQARKKRASEFQGGGQ